MTRQELINKLQDTSTLTVFDYKVRVQKDEREYEIQDIYLTENYGDGHYIVLDIS